VLTPSTPRVRLGMTLIEVVITMVVAGIVLSVVSSISVRQQRLLMELADGVAVAGRLREISAILPTDFRGASAGARDIREATDTSIELRATIASAVVCDTLATALVLAPATDAASTYANFVTSITSGDTAWVFTPADSADDWRPSTISSVTTLNTAGRQCAPAGPRLGDIARALPRIVISLAPAPSSASAMLGAPIRVTRSARYSLYRASDQHWYVGERDWNTSTLRFNTIQPVSGPFLSAAAGGMTLTYLESSGAMLPAPVADTRAIAAIRASFLGESKTASTVLGSAASTGKRLDSSSVVILLHNRR
jgi:prepilin-type N-terminal cleavage/methylation domain-containing protein